MPIIFYGENCKVGGTLSSGAHFSVLDWPRGALYSSVKIEHDFQ